jgi:hypothetical protein
MAENYEVGYGKPPQHTRFKKGRSGHPEGRPKGTPNLRSAIRRAAEEKVKVHIGDRTLTMRSIEAMAYKLVQKALGGDIKAVKAVIELGGLDQSFADAAAQGAATMRAEDLHLLRRALERGSGQPPVSPDPSTVETPAREN